MKGQGCRDTYQQAVCRSLLELGKEATVCMSRFLRMLHSSRLVLRDSLLLHGQLRALSPQLCLSILQGTELLLHLPANKSASAYYTATPLL